MQAAKSAPRKGDLLEYLFSPEHGTSMRFNGTELISGLSGDVFGLLLRTWIGAIPPSTSFKEELLGNQRNTRARDLLQTLTPSEERIALAASWIAPKKSEPKKSEHKKSEPKKPAPPVPASSKPAITAANIAAEKSEPESKPRAELEEVTAGDTDTSQQIAEIPEAASSDRPTDTQATITTTTAATTTAIETDSRNGSAENEEAEEEVDFNISQALAQRDYTPLVVQKIYQNISYPSRAVTRNQEGTVRVALQIGRTGELQAVLTTQESKHSSLNKAALKAVQKAAPFPELPEAITADSFELSIPITFRLQ